MIWATVLGLGACNGGGGGDGNGGFPQMIPDANRIQPADVTSNAVITAMASEVGVDADGNRVILARNATGAIDRDGIRYIAYRLDDVDFDAIVTSGDTDDLRFTIDKNGRINGIRFDNDTHCAGDKCPAAMFNTMARVGDTNKFDFTSPNTTGTAEYISYGREMGMKYADFGTIKIDGTFNGNAYQSNTMFAGGYDVMEVDDKNIRQNVTFTGTARGTVTGANNKSIELADNAATLNFDPTNGTETIKAKFFNWYDVNVIKNDATDQINIALDQSGKTIDNDLQYANAPSANLKDGINQTGAGTETVVFETSYYGQHNNPTESTALFQYQQTAPDGKTVNAVIGFGGKN